MSLWAPLCWTNSNSEFNFSGEISQQWTDSAWLPLCSQPTFQYRSLLPLSEWISTSISPPFFNRHCKMGSVIIWEGLPPCHWMLDGRTLYRTDFCYYFMKSTVRLLSKSLTIFLWVSLLSTNCTEKTPPPLRPSCYNTNKLPTCSNDSRGRYMNDHCYTVYIHRECIA